MSISEKPLPRPGAIYRCIDGDMPYARKGELCRVVEVDPSAPDTGRFCQLVNDGRGSVSYGINNQYFHKLYEEVPPIMQVSGWVDQVRSTACHGT